jgi:hypothetical protein
MSCTVPLLGHKPSHSLFGNCIAHFQEATMSDLLKVKRSF